MKTFEEKWTAWVDDELSAAERAEFEASLDDRAAAEAEKHQAHKLGALLKEELHPRAMGNEEFFHLQLRNRIAAETGQRAVCLDKSILRDILGLRRIPHKAGNEPPELALVLGYQQIKGVLIATLNALYQLLIDFPVCHP